MAGGPVTNAPDLKPPAPGGDNGEAGQESGDWLLAEAARFRAVPQFGEAVRQYTIGLSRMREAPRLLNKLISNEVRFRVIGYLLYLHADRERFGPQGGATYGRLLELCTRRKEVSPRVLKTMLAMLQLTGFVEGHRDESDRRLKFYRPTARMFRFVELWLGYATASLDALQPRGHRTKMLRDDPGFTGRFLVSGGRDHIAGAPPADRAPAFVAFFGGREGASAVILAVMLAQFDGVAPPSRARIARQFGLSKTQVSNIVGEGVRLGYFVLDAASAPAPTAHLHASYRRWISIELAFYARHMRPAGEKWAGTAKDEGR